MVPAGGRGKIGTVKSDQIRDFLVRLGDRYPAAAQLYLLGGGALCLLGSSRPTLDLDYLGDDIKKDSFQKEMEQLGRQMGLDVEAVPLDRFVPIPADAEKRNLHFGRFGNIEVYILDPYSIALSKVDRGFDTDFDDILFLVGHKLIAVDELERITREALRRAREFDMDAGKVLAHLQEVKKRLK